MQCPACHSPRVYPSRHRGLWERLRQKMTDQQPYRCHACNWRAWRPVDFGGTDPDVRPDDLRTGREPNPPSSTDVDQLDPA